MSRQSQQCILTCCTQPVFNNAYWTSVTKLTNVIPCYKLRPAMRKSNMIKSIQATTIAMHSFNSPRGKTMSSQASKTIQQACNKPCN